MKFKQLLLSTAVASLILGAGFSSSVALADANSSNIVVYVTRHAEKLTVVDELEMSPGMYQDNCNDDRSRCEEALNEFGQVRAELLAEWFDRRRIADTVTHVISSDKQRTRQTVQPLATLLLERDVALFDPNEKTMTNPMSDADGVWQVPFAGEKDNEINGNSGSVVPTVDAIKSLQPGDVAVVAAHSGTIYRIFGGEDTDGNPDTDLNFDPEENAEPDTSVGLGIDTTLDEALFPKAADGKVPTFGDLWKIVIRSNGKAVVRWRRSLQVDKLDVVETVRPLW